MHSQKKIFGPSAGHTSTALNPRGTFCPNVRHTRPVNSNSLRFLSALCAVLFVTATRAADLIPSSQLANWTPGVTVGVPGGVGQYVTGRTRLIDVTKSP